jgi:hypothetical protein
MWGFDVPADDEPDEEPLEEPEPLEPPPEPPVPPSARSSPPRSGGFPKSSLAYWSHPAPSQSHSLLVPPPASVYEAQVILVPSDSDTHEELLLPSE